MTQSSHSSENTFSQLCAVLLTAVRRLFHPCETTSLAPVDASLAPRVQSPAPRVQSTAPRDTPRAREEAVRAKGETPHPAKTPGSETAFRSIRTKQRSVAAAFRGAKGSPAPPKSRVRARQKPCFVVRKGVFYVFCADLLLFVVYNPKESCNFAPLLENARSRRALPDVSKDE